MFDIMMRFDNYRFKVVLINTKSLKMSIDEKIYNITKEDLDTLYRILIHFDSNDRSSVLDPVIYSIKMDDVTYSGDSGSNKNFYMLNDWIGGIYDR